MLRYAIDFLESIPEEICTHAGVDIYLTFTKVSTNQELYDYYIKIFWFIPCFNWQLNLCFWISCLFKDGKLLFSFMKFRISHLLDWFYIKYKQ